MPPSLGFGHGLEQATIIQQQAVVLDPSWYAELERQRGERDELHVRARQDGARAPGVGIVSGPPTEEQARASHGLATVRRQDEAAFRSWRGTDALGEALPVVSHQPGRSEDDLRGA